MKTTYRLIRPLGNFFGRLARAIVSGLPNRKVLYKPETKTIIQNKRDVFKTDSEKHYHRPTSKPPVEKQTLLREKKKAKNVH